MNPTLSNAMISATGSINSGSPAGGAGVLSAATNFANFLLNPFAPATNAGYNLGKQVAPQVVQVAKSTGTAIGGAVSGVGKTVTDILGKPVEAVGKFVDSTLTKVIIIGAVALVGVVVVKKVLD